MGRALTLDLFCFPPLTAAPLCHPLGSQTNTNKAISGSILRLKLQFWAEVASCGLSFKLGPTSWTRNLSMGHKPVPCCSVLSPLVLSSYFITSVNSLIMFLFMDLEWTLICQSSSHPDFRFIYLCLEYFSPSLTSMSPASTMFVFYI